MGSKSARTATLRLSEVESASSDTSRYVDVGLVLRRESNGQNLLEVGGRWDRAQRKYVGEASVRHVIYIKESQVELCIALKEWLKKRMTGVDREIQHFAGVVRGGGKTHWFVLALVVIAIALPGAVTWAVSPTHAKRDEIERILRNQLPRWLGWWLYRSQPEFRFTWITGSVLRLLSGEIPETVKQGGVEALFINEAQDQSRKVYSLGLPAIRNNEGRPAGILFIAANPPQRVRGEWVNELAEKLQSGQIDGKYFSVDPSLNDSVEHRALDKVAKAIQSIDPDAARTDLSGEWLPVGERAYPMWRSVGKIVEGERRPSLVGVIPDIGYTDVTSDVLRRAGVWRSSGRAYLWALGADFQGRPHMAATAGKVYRGTDGKLLYYFRYEFIARGDEHDLSEEILDGGICSPDNAAMIADASGEWQSGSNRRRSNPSFETLKSQRWTVIPPREKLREQSKYASNPSVERSLGEMFVVMRENRILVHPDCKWLIESLEKCPLKREGARPKIPALGGYSHVTDTVRYFVHRFEPKTVKKIAAGTELRAASFPHLRPGSGFQY